MVLKTLVISEENFEWLQTEASSPRKISEFLNAVLDKHRNPGLTEELQGKLDAIKQIVEAKNG